MANVDATTIYFHNVPEAKQSVIRMSRPSVTRSEADFAKLDALNFPLGGIYTSKLMTELRVNKGYTYGVGSGVIADDEAGSFVIRTSVRTNATKESLEIIDDILGEHGRNMTDAELAELKDALMRGQALETETLNDKLQLVQRISRDAQPTNFAAQNMSLVQDMTLEDVADLANAHFRPDAMRVIVVGDAASQRARLDDLGYEIVDLN